MRHGKTLAIGLVAVPFNTSAPSVGNDLILLGNNETFREGEEWYCQHAAEH